MPGTRYSGQGGGDQAGDHCHAERHGRDAGEAGRAAEAGDRVGLAHAHAQPVRDGLQDAVARAGRTFGSIEASYGNNSQFQRELERAMTQVGDTARSIMLLADFLDRHPEALVRGRTGSAAER